MPELLAILPKNCRLRVAGDVFKQKFSGLNCLLFFCIVVRKEKFATICHVNGKGPDAVGKVHVLEHPLIQHKLTYIRDVNTGSKELRELVNEVAMLMAFEITRHLPVREVMVQTPVREAQSFILAGKKLGLVPILRAGLGMVDGVLRLIPAAKVGHVGLYRDPNTLEPVEYYVKLPSDVQEREFIVIDPMLATGGSASAAINALKTRGAKSIKLMCLVGAPEGVEKIAAEHPDVDIYLAALDESLNEKGYIVPGLGDAGDRLFGTK